MVKHSPKSKPENRHIEPVERDEHGVKRVLCNRETVKKQCNKSYCDKAKNEQESFNTCNMRVYNSPNESDDDCMYSNQELLTYKVAHIKNGWNSNNNVTSVT